jgi:prokaryotic ubiquitin-like protein Pup
MPEQERKQTRSETPPSTEGGQGAGAIAAKGKKLKDEMDRLVDEIDDVLEENAEEFVKSYVQRGGE